MLFRAIPSRFMSFTPSSLPSHTLPYLLPMTYLCLSTCLSVCLSVSLSICLSVCLSVCLSICLLLIFFSLTISISFYSSSVTGSLSEAETRSRLATRSGTQTLVINWYLPDPISDSVTLRRFPITVLESIGYGQTHLWHRRHWQKLWLWFYFGVHLQLHKRMHFRYCKIFLKFWIITIKDDSRYTKKKVAWYRWWWRVPNWGGQEQSTSRAGAGAEQGRSRSRRSKHLHYKSVTDRPTVWLSFNKFYR